MCVGALGLTTDAPWSSSFLNGSAHGASNPFSRGNGEAACKARGSCRDVPLPQREPKRRGRTAGTHRCRSRSRKCCEAALGDAPLPPNSPISRGNGTGAAALGPASRSGSLSRGAATSALIPSVTRRVGRDTRRARRGTTWKPTRGTNVGRGVLSPTKKNGPKADAQPPGERRSRESRQVGTSRDK